MRSTHVLSLTCAVLWLAAGCGGGAPSRSLRLREVVLYQNGVAYLSREGRVEGRRMRLAVRPHEMDDVLATLTIVDPSDDGSGGSGGSGPPASAPTAVVPRSDADAEEVHTLVVDLGERRRDLRVGYATQTSAWRASYRLVLSGRRGPTDSLLQGWAIVDNTTAEDWRDVSLTLATAAPLSFAVDLRTPRVVDRPNVTGHLAPPVALGPVYAERARGMDRDADGILDEDDACPGEAEVPNGFEDADGCPDRARVVVQENRIVIRDGNGPGEGAPGGLGGGSGGSVDAEGAAAPSVEGLERAMGAVPAPRAGASGTRYEVAGRISVPAGESAMVAMLDARVTGEDVLLFRADPNVPGSAEHPFRAARLRNDSEVDLVPGPVSLYAGPEFLGEGLIDGLLVGQNAFVPYALDEGTHVRSRVESEALPSRVLSLAGGELTLEQIAVERTVFDVTPGERVPRRIYLHVDRGEGWDPHEPPPGTETTPHALLVPVPLSRFGGDDPAPFVVEQRTARRVAVDLVDDVDVSLAPYVDGGVPDGADVQRLRALVADRAALRDLGQRVALHHTRLEENAQRANELRRSLESLADTGPETARTRRRLAATLEEAVRDGEQLAARLAELRARQVEAREALRRAAADFVIEE